MEIEIAMQYNDSYDEKVFSFANNINTHEGGTHLVGFKAALTRTMNNYADANNLLKNDKVAISGDDLREGLDLRHFGQDSPAAVRGTDQDQAGQLRGQGVCGNPHEREAGHLPGGKPADCQRVSWRNPSMRPGHGKQPAKHGN